MKLTIDVPEELYQAVRAILAAKPFSIEELIEGALATYVLGETGDIETPTGLMICSGYIEDAIKEKRKLRR